MNTSFFCVKNGLTAVDQGYPGYLVEGWIAVVGPKGMVPEQVKRINTAFAAAFSTPEVKESMAKQGKGKMSAWSQGQVLYCNILLLHACLKTRVFKPEITTELLCNGLLECLWRRFLHVFPKTSLVSGTTATYAHFLTQLGAAPVQPGDTEA